MRPRRIKITMAPLIELAAEILRGVPSLPNAACRDHGDLMDATTATDIDIAIALCQRCDDLAAFKQWLRTLPRVRQSAGVTGAKYRPPPPIAKPSRGKEDSRQHL